MDTHGDYGIGVEEEYQVIDPDTRELAGRADRVLRETRPELADAVMPELQTSQLEAVSRICRTLGDAQAELSRLRRGVIEAAERGGHRVAAAGSHPFSHWREQRITPNERYVGIAEQYQQLAQEQVVFGCHIHVGLSDRDAGIHVLNRARVWLAPLLALSANSPYWLGDDTGHASYRTVIWGRFPVSGAPAVFASRGEHDALIRALVSTGSVSDMTKVYWDVRLPEKTPTVEFRVADVCIGLQETVMLAGLARALVHASVQAAERDDPFPAPRPELLRAAQWRAARYGLDANLVDLVAERERPARELVEALLQHVRPSLEEFGDWEEVSTLTREQLRSGNGASRQRQAHERAGRIEDVVDMLVEETARGV